MLEPDMILNKMDELIASVKAASIPLEERWLDSSAAAALMGYSPRQFSERIACLPDFPKPFRLDASGHPRYKAQEILTWMDRRRTTIRPGPKRRPLENCQ